MDTVSDRWNEERVPRPISDAEKAYKARLKQEPAEPGHLTNPTALALWMDAELRKAEPAWTYNEANKALLSSLKWWVLGNQYELTKSAYDLSAVKGGRSLNKLNTQKGVLIYGKYGVGKTTIMRVVAKALGFKQTTCINVIADYNGARSLRKYELGDWYFDDLGREREPQFSKKGELKLLSDLLEQRYFNRRGRTIVSTNLTLEDIGELYGERMRSRCFEMFNLYALGSPGGVDYRTTK